MPHPKVKISDDSGNTVAVDTSGASNALKVALVDSASIDIGDVSLLLGGTAADTDVGVYGAQTLRVTLATNDPLLTLISSNIIDIEALLTTIDTDTGYLPFMNSYLDVLSKTTGSDFTTGYYGINALAVRSDTLESIAGITDGEYIPLQTDSIGGLYVTGSEIENAAVQSEPLLIGGRYDSSARTLGDGDAGAVALNASGHVIMDVVDGGQLDTIIDTLETTLTAIETDQAAIEALLITIDSDTDAIKTAVEILDDWDATHDSAVVADGIQIMGEAKVIDGSALPNTVAEGDAARLALARSGVLYTTLTDDGGTKGLAISDDSEQVATPAMLNVGGEYRASPTSYTDGDATILQTNVNGALNVVGTVDLGSTDNAVLDSIAASLVTIDSDTDAIKTAVELIDNAIDGSEMQVDVVASLPAGTNAIGKLSANSGVDIGDVDITSIAAGDNNIGNVDIASLPTVLGITNGSGSVFHLSGDSFTQILDPVISVGTLMSDVLAAPANTTDGDWCPLQVDTQGALYTTHGITGVVSASNGDIGTSAEDLLASGNVACKRVDIMAHPDNTGYIQVGGSGLNANKGVRLAPGDFYSVDVNGTSDVQVLAEVDGEDVSFTYFT